MSSNRPQRNAPVRGYPAIFPARSNSLEPEAWPNVESGFRRADLLLAPEPRLMSDDLLREPQIPKAPTVPRVHVPRTRALPPLEEPAPALPVVTSPIEPEAPPGSPKVAAKPAARRDERANLWVVVVCFFGLVAATLALLGGVF